MNVNIFKKLKFNWFKDIANWLIYENVKINK